MKKIILLTYCALFSLTVGLEDAYSAQKTSNGGQSQALVKKAPQKLLRVAGSKATTLRKTTVQRPDYSLIGKKSDIISILLLKLRIADSRYLDSVRQKTANIRKQITKLSKNAQSVKRLAEISGFTSSLVGQELNQIVELLKNIETNIQTVLQTKNDLSQSLKLKMDLDNAHAQIDLIGLLQIISNSVPSEFQAIENRCSVVTQKITDPEQKAKYEQLRDLLEKYRLALETLNESVNALVEKFQNLNTNINIAYTDQRSVSELIFGTSDNQQNAYSIKDEEELIDPQEHLISLSKKLPNLANAYVEYNTTPTKDVLQFAQVPQILQLMQTNLRAINAAAHRRFAQACSSFNEASISQKIDTIPELASIYNSAVTTHNNEVEATEQIKTISNTDVLIIKKRILSNGFDALINDLQTAQNSEDSSATQKALEGTITRIQQWKSNFIDNPTWKTFNDALNTCKSTMTRLGKSANISQEVVRLSSPEFRRELQEAIQNIGSPTSQAQVHSRQNRSSSLTDNNNQTRLSSTKMNDYNKSNSQRFEDADNSGKQRANSKLSTSMPRITASKSIKGF